MTAQLPSKELLKATIADWEAAREEIPFGLGEEGDNTLAALKFALAAHEQEPVAWRNGCNETVPAALRYLAEHPRPIAGESWYNTAHLYQLAREIEQTAANHPAPSIPAAVPDVQFDGHSPYDVPCSMPSNLRELIAEEIGILFSEDDAQGIWTVCRRAAMLSGGKS